MFKENDFITGSENNTYTITNKKMTLAIVLRVLKNKQMFIMILNHITDCNIFCIYKVLNDERKFSIVNSVPEISKNQYLSLTNQIRHTGCDFCGRKRHFNNKVEEMDSTIINNVSFKINLTEIEKLNIISILNKYYHPNYIFYPI